MVRDASYLILETAVFLALLYLVLWLFDGINSAQQRRWEEQARKHREHWLRHIEPEHRNDGSVEGYPEDWGMRRAEVYARAKGMCERCGRDVSRGYHVHHKIPLSAGGTHALDNLELLCPSCHVSEHPNNAHLRRNVALQILSRVAVQSGEVRRARKLWWCEACSAPIQPGQDYFVAIWKDKKRYHWGSLRSYPIEAKFCLSCAPTHERRIGAPKGSLRP